LKIRYLDHTIIWHEGGGVWKEKYCKGMHEEIEAEDNREDS